MEARIGESALLKMTLVVCGEVEKRDVDYDGVRCATSRTTSMK
jgi:hypothetical protein